MVYYFKATSISVSNILLLCGNEKVRICVRVCECVCVGWWGVCVVSGKLYAVVWHSPWQRWTFHSARNCQVGRRRDRGRERGRKTMRREWRGEQPDRGPFQPVWGWRESAWVCVCFCLSSYHHLVMCGEGRACLRERNRSRKTRLMASRYEHWYLHLRACRFSSKPTTSLSQYYSSYSSYSSSNYFSIKLTPLAYSSAIELQKIYPIFTHDWKTSA